ncbi:hypothetical protein [Alteromonas gilva]|uniref:Uncharacterized protein n=1 Tax=Alteromonas gilva TaxID=2987522 RepID=A0ABT5KYW8_9ALTE|nr:hypothetical protein [Alteromonas gilva]MDC8829962.1 hypothetical protein [Alteromonas gilva]
MFRSVVLIIEISILVVVLQLPFVQSLFADVQVSLSDWMTEIAMREERAQLADIKKGIAAQYSAMRPYQQEYVDSVLSTRAQTMYFYHAYCINNDINPYVYGATLASMCTEIDSSAILGSGQKDA